MCKMVYTTSNTSQDSESRGEVYASLKGAQHTPFSKILEVDP